MRLIQLIKDFRKWRKEKYEEKYNEVIRDTVCTALINVEDCGKRRVSIMEFGEIMLKYGINHRKEIFKMVKI